MQVATNYKLYYLGQRQSLVCRVFATDVIEVHSSTAQRKTFIELRLKIQRPALGHTHLFHQVKNRFCACDYQKTRQTTSE